MTLGKLTVLIGIENPCFVEVKQKYTYFPATKKSFADVDKRQLYLENEQTREVKKRRALSIPLYLRRLEAITLALEGARVVPGT